MVTNCKQNYPRMRRNIELTLTLTIYGKADYARFYHAFSVSFMSEYYNLEFINVPLPLIMLFLG